MSTLTHSQRLRQKIELVLPDHVAAATELVSHPNFRELYPELLVRMHWMVRVTVPIMTVTLNRCRELASYDPVAARLAPYFEQHIKEEMHHDEWLLEDIELLGTPRADVLRRLPSATAATCAGARYYWVHHHHPVAELGALAVLEGYPPTIEAIDLMQKLTGYPRAAFRTLEKHSHIDVVHRDQMLAVIDSLPLNDHHHEVLGVAALHTTQTASTLYRDLIDDAPEILQRVAA